ncbi:MAG: hypothetical protein IKE18_03025 [Oscillospiraceae bacterium]|nr:hypothetical protein [Oscillospiraceae bacterium]
MSENNRFSWRTLGLWVLMVVLVLGITEYIGSTRADLIYESGSEDIRVSMSNLSVQLLENGDPVAEDGVLLSSLSGRAVDPGYRYEEKIAARNNSGLSEYVRMIVKKYWRSAEGEKIVVLDPSLIRLEFGSGTYNDSDWVINPKEHTAEQDVYYCRKALEAGKDSALLFDSISIDPSVAGKVVFVDEEGNEIPDIESYTGVIKGSFDYDGVEFGVEVEVQSVQFSNAEDAIASAWGVPNVSISGDEVTVG